MTYSSLFKCKRIHTYLLQDSYVLNELIREGYRYIRRFNYVQFHEITRYPTMGCIVELFTFISFFNEIICCSQVIISSLILF